MTDAHLPRRHDVQRWVTAISIAAMLEWFWTGYASVWLALQAFTW